MYSTRLVGDSRTTETPNLCAVPRVYTEPSSDFVFWCWLAALPDVLKSPMTLCRRLLLLLLCVGLLGRNDEGLLCCCFSLFFFFAFTRMGTRRTERIVHRSYRTDRMDAGRLAPVVG